MTTSGTVATTVIDTATVIETAFRRCRVHPSKQTPEKIQIAQNSLYLLLTHLANNGLNLWAIEKDLIGCTSGQSVYSCPPGTIDLLNVVYSQPTRQIGTDSSTATSYTTQLTTASAIIRFGIKLSAVTASDTMTFAYSNDGATWTTVLTSAKTTWATGLWYWFDALPIPTGSYFRVTFGNAATFTDFYLASAIYDLPLSQWNRDTWSVINEKYKLGRPSTNYYFEKLITPQFTLWPVPNNNFDHVTVFVHRMVQDVGTLIQTLEIPARWFEAVIWQLAVRLCFEIEDVDAAWAPNVMQMAEKIMAEVESEETDGAPLFIVPNIRGYNA